MLKSKQIGFIGGGAIAESIIKGIIKAGLINSQQIIVNDVSKERLDYLKREFNIKTALDVKDVTTSVQILFLTIKPQVINQVLENISPLVSKNTLVISVAAGITLDILQNSMLEVPIVRVMPNTPVAVGEGMSALALGNYASKQDGELVSAIFSSIGKSVILSESLMDAVTGLSGSGPGYAFVMIDALADAGVKVGLTRQNSLMMAAQTLLGAAKMVLETNEHPAKLRDMVTSPGGTTIAGIHVMEQKNVRAALIDAVEAATQRSRQMGKK